MTITKKDFVKLISEHSSLNYIESKEIFDLLMDEMKVQLDEGQRIELRGFGVFERKIKASRQGRNPRTGEIVEVPAKSVIGFRPSKHLEVKLNGNGNENQKDISEANQTV